MSDHAVPSCDPAPKNPPIHQSIGPCKSKLTFLLVYSYESITWKGSETLNDR